MSLPNNQLTTNSLRYQSFLTPIRNTKLTDYEWGGVGIGNATQGLGVQIWQCAYDVQSGQVRITAPNQTTPTTLLTLPNITEIGLAFDQNMRPLICYVQNGICKLYWYDPVVSNNIHTVFGIAGEYQNPCVSLDDKRPDFISGNSDVIFAYVRAGNVYWRQQRDRFTVEYGGTAAAGVLWQIGMTNALRFEFLCL